MASARTTVLLATIFSCLMLFEPDLMLPAAGFRLPDASSQAVTGLDIAEPLNAVPVGLPSVGQDGEPVFVAAARRRRYRRRYRGRRRRHRRKPRYAYPLDFFVLKAPEFNRSHLPSELATDVRRSFYRGTAGKYPANSLVRSGLVKYHPLRGGIFWRREPVKFVIIHSTETGVPVGATRVIDSWSSLGRRHAGAQYVVERDGTIYQAVDPDLGCVHVNIFKTLKWINNDNTIGIEMVHSGKQNYPAEQRVAVIRLTSYLQSRYHVKDKDVITHRYAQQGDHTDPVRFDWVRFKRDLSHFNRRAEVEVVQALKEESEKGIFSEVPFAITFLEPHGKIKINGIFPMPDPVRPRSPAAAKDQASSGKGNFHPEALKGHMEMDPAQARVLSNQNRSEPDQKDGSDKQTGESSVNVDNDHPYAPVPGVGIEMVP